MKIVFVSHSADLYGASRSMLRIAQRLKADGHEPVVVLPENGPLCGALHESGIATVEHPWMAIIDRASFRSLRGFARLLVSFPASVMFLARMFRRLKPDVVHTNTSVIFSSGLAARLCGVPHVWHIRESYDDFPPTIWKLYRRYMVAMSDLVPCISIAVQHQFDRSAKAQMLYDGYPRAEFEGAKKMEIMHNAYPREEFEHIGAERRATVEQLMGPGRPRVTLVGRIKLVRKGQDTFVRAAALLKDQFPAARFVIVGAPFTGNENHLDELTRLVAELDLTDRVVFTGEIHDAPAVFAASDIAVMASGTPEPLGGVTIEAMAMSRPVVGTNIGGTPEIIADGETGFLVPPNDPPAMADALARLLADEALRKRMGEAGRRRYLEHFEFDPFYEKMTSLYRQLCPTKEFQRLEKSAP